jgi:hypothetical protein
MMRRRRMPRQRFVSPIGDDERHRTPAAILAVTLD